MSLPLSKEITLPNGLKYTQPLGLFINNEFVKPKNGGSLETVNPATEEVITEVYAADEADVDIAVEAAREAYTKVWKKTPGPEGLGFYETLQSFLKNNETCYLQLMPQIQVSLSKLT